VESLRSDVLKSTEYLKSKIRIPKSKICFLKFLFFDQTGCPLAGGRRSFETTYKANRRMSKGGIALLSLFNKIDRIHYSMFDVGCSMFDVH